MNITLRQLRIFLAVAERRHFRRAADSLHLTPPAVSRQIADLETALGVRLFDRSTREVVVTAAGRYLHHAMDRLLDELEGALQHLASESEQRRGKVRIASVPTLSASLMPAAIAACARDYTELEIMLRDQTQTLVLAAVRGGEVDFGVVIEPPASEDLDVQTIMHDDFCLVLPAQHPLAARRQIGWKALGSLPLVLLDHDSGSRRLLDQAFARIGLEPRVAQQAGHTYTLFRMVEAGLGLTVVPRLALPLPQGSGLVTRSLTPRLQREVKLVRRHNRSLSPAADTVWQILAEQAAALEAKP